MTLKSAAFRRSLQTVLFAQNKYSFHSYETGSSKRNCPDLPLPAFDHGETVIRKVRSSSLHHYLNHKYVQQKSGNPLTQADPIRLYPISQSPVRPVPVFHLLRYHRHPARYSPHQTVRFHQYLHRHLKVRLNPIYRSYLYLCIPSS